MKKIKYIPLVLGILVFGGVVYRMGMWKQPIEVEVEEKVVENKIEILEIEYSEENQVVVERENAEGESALEFLENVTKDEKIDLETTEYDFGVLVDAIGGIGNTKEKSWIYFVNEKSAEVGAGEYVLEDGDLVEWKYIEPSF